MDSDKRRIGAGPAAGVQSLQLTASASQMPLEEAGDHRIGLLGLRR